MFNPLRYDGGILVRTNNILHGVLVTLRTHVCTGCAAVFFLFFSFVLLPFSRCVRACSMCTRKRMGPPYVHYTYVYGIRL